MPDIGKAYVQIVPTTRDITATVTQELSGVGDSGEQVGSSWASKLKSAVMAAGIGAAITKVLSASLEAGGAIQQSFGGLDTLYGDASEQAKEYAMAAAQAGISANEYAEQAVSFGASLKAAFGGDTIKAAEAANTAILDMADNSAKMGTDLSAIQSAYQGFAKQNYTMLDNLKLGYGGTKTEMERLLADAQKLSGIKYDINNLGDVYSAIHVIQEDLGLTGVAAAEASETLTGSAGAVKAAFQNVLASMSTGMDMTGPLTQLITSFSGFMFNNFIPMLGNIITSIPGALSTAIPLVIDQITTQATNLLNGQSAMQFLQSGVTMLTNLINGIVSKIPEVLSTAGTMITNFVGAILSNLPAILSMGVEMIGNLVSGIISNLPSIVSSAAQMIAGFLAEVASHLPELLQKGIELLGEVGAGIIQAIPELISKIPEVISGIVGAFKEYDWLSIGKDILTGIGEGIKSAVSGLVDAAKNAAGALVDGVKGMFKIGSPSKLMADEIGQWIPAGIAMGINENIGVIDSAMNNMNSALIGANVVGAAYTPGQIYRAGGAGSEDRSEREVNVQVVLEGDAQQLFRVVRKQNQKFAMATGKGAF